MPRWYDLVRLSNLALFYPLFYFINTTFSKASCIFVHFEMLFWWFKASYLNEISYPAFIGYVVLDFSRIWEKLKNNFFPPLDCCAVRSRVRIPPWKQKNISLFLTIFYLFWLILSSNLSWECNECHSAQ